VRAPVVAVLACCVALTVTITDAPDRLNSPDAHWFGQSLSDGSLN
jgi:hypothetical protein